MTHEDFRDSLIALDAPRLVESRGLDPWTYARPIRATPRATDLIDYWQSLYAEPFTGITTDGRVVDNLYAIGDEGFDVLSAVHAANALIATMTADERSRARYRIDAAEWRDWYNPEWPMNSHGIRLDEATAATRDAVLGLLRSCFSEEGLRKTSQVRSANRYLGELYDLPLILNEWSYHLLLFGEPSATEPWGWNLYGHHLALNCFVLGTQIVLSPSFMGAEPTTIDRGSGDRFELFRREALTGLELMGSLPPDVQHRAQTYRELKDPAMPPGRWHFADERALGGAYQDNRVIPYEGVRARDLSAGQHDALLAVVGTFVEHLPDRPRRARMRQVEDALDDTWWSWIGSYDGVSPFYYRVQSPVIMVEFDNHAGVWLTNSEPARFHVHTVVRTPNGNDYGKDLLRQHYADAERSTTDSTAPPHSHEHQHEHRDEHEHEHGHPHPH